MLLLFERSCSSCFYLCVHTFKYRCMPFELSLCNKQSKISWGLTLRVTVLFIVNWNEKVGFFLLILSVFISTSSGRVFDVAEL